MSSKDRDASAPSIWARPAPGERRPAHSRDQIVATALGIADVEGFESVSMRRIAAELGAGTMTLYHYVRTKDELVALIGDAIMGELLIAPDEVPEGWREGMAGIARRTRAVFARHPWIVERLGDRGDGAPSPNAMRHFEQSMAVAARTGLGLDGQFELAGLVDDYVFGYVIRDSLGDGPPDPGETADGYEALAPYLEQLLRTGEFPHLEAIAGDDPAGAFARIARLAADEDRFERGLQCLLDGVELRLRRRPGAGS